MKVQLRRHFNEEPQVLNHAGGVRDVLIVAVDQEAHLCAVATTLTDSTGAAAASGHSAGVMSVQGSPT
jgi:citrate synthase